MARFNSDEIVKLKTCLSTWQLPQEMNAIVEHAMTRLGSSNLFNQAGLEFLRDAWVAAEFGRIRNAQRTRLIADSWPDFELFVDDGAEVFEAVEADDPNRRRGEEYRQGIGEIEDDPVEDWIDRAEQAPMWLKTACQKKLNKRYGSRANLVVYLNLSEYGIRQAEVESCFPSATEAVKDAFEEVWVLWKARAYLVWRGGRSALNSSHFNHDADANSDE